MENTSAEKFPNQSPVPVRVVSAMDREEEINLVDLWGVIARRKSIILLMVITSFALAAMYLFFKQPVYQANSHLLPPQQRNIQALIDYDGPKTLDLNR